MILTVKRVTKSFTDKKDNRSGNKNNQSQNNKGNQEQSKPQNSETKQPNDQGQPGKGRKWKRKGNMPMSESNSGKLSEEEYKKLKEKIKKELEEEGKKKGEDVFAKYKKGLLYTGGGLATVGALGTGYYLYNKKKQADRKNRYGLNY
jgi:hypothetical protein